MTIKHYFDEPLIFEFTANVIDATNNADNTSNIILNETYFYPTGGGQSHDIGTLNGQAMIDVRKERETVIHVVEGDILA
ncbi:MAG: alanine--tRNA ligase-related protein, partial [Chloroflexota bacterium]